MFLLEVVKRFLLLSKSTKPFKSRCLALLSFHLLRSFFHSSRVRRLFEELVSRLYFSLECVHTLSHRNYSRELKTQRKIRSFVSHTPATNEKVERSVEGKNICLIFNFMVDGGGSNFLAIEKSYILKFIQ